MEIEGCIVNRGLTAVLMAGGWSRRMGSDKALIEFDGKPLWKVQMDLLRAVQPAALLVSARERPAWCPPAVDVVLDEPPARGPLGGLAATLSHTRTSHLLALAIDLPCMTSAQLQKLWDLARAGCGVIPLVGDRFEPLCAVYPVKAGEFARELLTGTDHTLQRLARSLAGKRLIVPYPVPASELPLFRNLNTPADRDQLARS